jgi:hypothetical protein
MNKNLKRTLLSGAAIGAFLLIPKWKSEENPEGIRHALRASRREG